MWKHNKKTYGNRHREKGTHNTYSKTLYCLREECSLGSRVRGTSFILSRVSDCTSRADTGLLVISAYHTHASFIYANSIACSLSLYSGCLHACILHVSFVIAQFEVILNAILTSSSIRTSWTEMFLSREDLKMDVGSTCTCCMEILASFCVVLRRKTWWLRVFSKFSLLPSWLLWWWARKSHACVCRSHQ